jgi:prepilin-type N-terminal cleavage/methylation domain-containing protein
MADPHRSNSGYTLIEMLLVVSVVAMLSALVVTNSDSGAHDRLMSLAKVIQTDLSYARSLAVANDTPYRVAFDADQGQYTLEHAGDNSQWDQLPASPFHPDGGSAVAQTVRLEDLPHVGGDARILGVFTIGADKSLTRVGDVTFGTIGQTQDRAEETVIWLACGAGQDTRYVAVQINPVTGLIQIGDFTGESPPIDDLQVFDASPGSPLQTLPVKAS